MRARRSTRILAAVVTAVVAAGFGAPVTAATRPLPQRLAHVGNSEQVVVVTTANWNTSYARLQTWQLSEGGEWRRVLDPVPARVGWSGVRRAENRLQDTGKTPAGTFDLVRGFGLSKPDGVDLRYRVVDSNDWWPYDPRDPKTYNVMQFHRSDQVKWRKTWAERLAGYTTQYRYSVVLDYNLPDNVKRRNGQRITTDPVNTRKGGGIFLHVNGDGATAGCISIARDDMRSVVKWLDPARDPIIVIGPRDVIDRM